MQDFNGKEIEVGQTVTFSTRSGSSAYLRIGTVTGFEECEAGRNSSWVYILTDKNRDIERVPNQVGVLA